MKPEQFLLKLVHFLNELDVDYVLTGSLAAAGVYGRPRLVQDFDLMVSEPPPTPASVETCFPPTGFTIEQRDIDMGVFRQSCIKITEQTMGWRAELFFENIPAVVHATVDEELPRAAWRERNRFIGHALFASSFQRRRRIPLKQDLVWMVAPEQILLIKLALCRYNRIFRDKDWQDALAVFAVQSGQLDLDYLNDASEQFGLNPFWEQLQRQGRTA